MVEIKAPGEHVYSFVRLPRLGLPIIGTLADSLGYDVRIFIEEMTPVDLHQISSADLLCISTITSTAPAAYRLADRARSAGVPVVLGGAHATYLPDEGMEHADWVLRGEAEKSFRLFLDMLKGREDPSCVPGLSHRVDGQVVHNPMESMPVDMDSVPIPDFSLLAGKTRNKFHRGVIPIQASRGCPHACRFCSVTPMFGRKIRFASHEHVAEELQRRRGQGKMVFFYDDNFCASPARTKSLLDHLMTRDVFLPPWYAQVSVRAAKDPELLRLMQRSGCKAVFVGFESIEPETLTLFHKSQTVDDIRQAIRQFHRHGIWVHGMFMTGSDADGVDTIRATARFAIEEDIDSIQFAVLTPLPGTPVFDEMDRQGRLFTKDWSLYDGHHAVFRPVRMSAYTLMDETIAAMSRVYARHRIPGMLVRGNLKRVMTLLYANAQVRRWRRNNRHLMKSTERAATGLGAFAELSVGTIRGSL